MLILDSCLLNPGLRPFTLRPARHLHARLRACLAVLAYLPIQLDPHPRRRQLRQHLFHELQGGQAVQEHVCSRAMRRLLERLGGRISADEMRAMNYAADVERRDVAQIVKDFLDRRPS